MSSITSASYRARRFSARASLQVPLGRPAAPAPAGRTDSTTRCRPADQLLTDRAQQVRLAAAGVAQGQHVLPARPRRILEQRRDLCIERYRGSRATIEASPASFSSGSPDSRGAVRCCFVRRTSHSRSASSAGTARNSGRSSSARPRADLLETLPKGRQMQFLQVPLERARARPLVNSCPTCAHARTASYEPTDPLPRRSHRRTAGDFPASLVRRLSPPPRLTAHA